MPSDQKTKYLGLSEGEFDLLLFDLRSEIRIARNREEGGRPVSMLKRLLELLYDYKIRKEMGNDDG